MSSAVAPPSHRVSIASGVMLPRRTFALSRSSPERRFAPMRPYRDRTRHVVGPSQEMPDSPTGARVLAVNARRMLRRPGLLVLSWQSASDCDLRMRADPSHTS